MRNTLWVEGRVHLTEDGRYVAVLSGSDEKAASTVSGTLETPLEALDWLYDKAKSRGIALSWSLSWDEPKE